MAFGTHAVPVLSVVGPVEPVIGFDFLSFVNRIGDIIPDFSFGVPGERQGLKTAFLKGDEVLLQGLNAEGVSNLKIAWYPTGAFGVDEKLIVFFVKAADKTVLFKNSIVEITQNGRSDGRIHGVVMVGALPVVVFRFVALNTGVAARKGGLLPGGTVHATAGNQ